MPIGPPRRKPSADLRVGEDTVGMLDVVEHPDAVHHLEARLQADEKTTCSATDLYRAKRDAFDNRGIWPSWFAG